jgi:magnesium chelatase subunit H
MPNDMSHITSQTRYSIVIITLDSHSVQPCHAASQRMLADFPGLSIEIFAAAEWGEQPHKLHAAIQAIETADIVIANLLFLEDHVKPILPAMEKRRDHCDAMIGVICDAALVKLTKMGALDMNSPQSGALKLLKKLRGSSKPNSETGESKMRMLRRLPKILKFIPGKAQDLRSWFLIMQYWLGGTDDNVEGMLRMLLSRYCSLPDWRGGVITDPKMYADVGLYHPDLPNRITTELADLPNQKPDQPTIGLLLMRSYVLSGDSAHYDAVIRRFEDMGMNVIPAFAGGLDGRPAISQIFPKRCWHQYRYIGVSYWVFVGGWARIQ